MSGTGIRITKANREGLLSTLLTEKDTGVPWNRLGYRGIITANKLIAMEYARLDKNGPAGWTLHITERGFTALSEGRA